MTDEPIDPAVVAALDELSDGDESFFDQMLVVFLKDLNPSLEKLASASTAEETEVLYKGAHRLKSAAANIGAHALAEACFEVERAARGGDLARARTGLEVLVDRAKIVVKWAEAREPVAATG